MSDVQTQLDHLAELHLAVLGLLKSRVISLSVRSNLELYREELEKEIARLKQRQPKDVAA